MKNVYLVPGYLAGDLKIVSNDFRVWWDPSVSMLLGVGALRLKPNGIDPKPPDGEALYVDPNGQNPWPIIRFFLRNQLNPSTWNVEIFGWDWRKDISAAADALAALVVSRATPTEPATLVGHSAGGLVSVLAYAILVGQGKQNLIRRIITICTPFRGSYGPIMFANGLGGSITQLLSIGSNPIAAAADGGIGFTLSFLANLMFTWPSSYQLLPNYADASSDDDPNRVLLYNAANYSSNLTVDQAWLDQSRTVFQALISAPASFPPTWVATYIYGTGVSTPIALRSSSIPLDLRTLFFADDGDGVVDKGSQIRLGGKVMGYPGAHSSLPGGLAFNGDLAKEILDPRGPPDPTPEPFLGTIPIGISISDAPISDPENGTTCIGGG